MSVLVPSRRGFLGGLLGLVASPAIVRVGSLMPISVLEPEFPIRQVALGYSVNRFPTLSDIVEATIQRRERELTDYFQPNNLLLERALPNDRGSAL